MRYFQSQIERLLYILLLAIVLVAVIFGALVYHNGQLVKQQQVTIISNEEKLNQNNEQYIRCVFFSLTGSNVPQIEASINKCLTDSTQGLRGTQP